MTDLHLFLSFISIAMSTFALTLKKDGRISLAEFVSAIIFCSQCFVMAVFDGPLVFLGLVPLSMLGGVGIFMWYEFTDRLE